MLTKNQNKKYVKQFLGLPVFPPFLNMNAIFEYHDGIVHHDIKFEFVLN